MSKNCKLTLSEPSKCGKKTCCMFCDEKETCIYSCEEQDEKCPEIVEEESMEVAFTKNHLSVFQYLQMFKKQKEEMEKEEKALKDLLLKAMDEAGIKSIDNEYIKITHVAEGKAAYVRFTVK